MNPILRTEHLSKQYKDFVAVDDVSLHVYPKRIYGLLGPNGAGKSTLMKMMLGLTKPTQGMVEIAGMQFPRNREKILRLVGSFIEFPAFYPNLTGRENLELLCRLLQLPSECVDQALEMVGLFEFGDRLAKTYSLGMKQRLGLAGALLGQPPILILDEPTNGLDPAGIHEIRSLIRSLPKQYDCTILISSHLLSEVERIADDIGIVNHGHLLFEGSLQNLEEYAKAKHWGGDLEDIFLRMIEQDNAKRKEIMRSSWKEGEV